MNMTGILFALTAALLNASIAIFSKKLFGYGLSPELIALYKSVIAAGILWCLPLRRFQQPPIGAAIVCAFLGIFVLFFFETKAYAYELAANVVFAMMATAALSSILLSRLILKEAIPSASWIGFLTCLLGLALLLDISQPTRLLGLLFAGIAGLGYGAFSVAAKKMQLGSGLAVTRGLLGFGACYLLIPAMHGGLSVPPLSALGLLAGLALLPSIGGFYCTTRAIQILTPSQVQILELSEPVFVLVLAGLFFRELPNAQMLFGAAVILAGICITHRQEQTGRLFNRTKEILLRR
ncbi:DMT family transporter [Paraherbaspirillum soli]|uniref:DMT family transporter n=1 Tax=Paraherbaspirillum soli TaxID=631222 RepID=A0ABW0MCT8_9BURK